MIGWINLSVEAFIRDSFGDDAWAATVAKAHAETNWLSACPYPDSVTYDLVISGASLLGVTPAQALEAYGRYFVSYVNEQGHEKLLQCLGSNLVQFLQALNDLHLHLSTSLPSMDAPAFRCTNVTETSCELHYYSHRPALWPIVKGIVEEIAQSMFKHPATMNLIASREPGEGIAESDHEVFLVTFPAQKASSDAGSVVLAEPTFAIDAKQFAKLHPFHLIVDEHLRIVQVGPRLAKMYPDTMRPGVHIGDSLVIRHPHVDMDFAAMAAERDSTFLFISRVAGLQLKAELIVVPHPSQAGAEALLIMGSPRLVHLEDLLQHQLHLSDIPLHNMARDYVLLMEHHKANFDLKNRLEANAEELKRTNAQLKKLSEQLQQEQERSQALVYQMLPQAVASRMLRGEAVEATAYDEVTVLFSDIVGFTPMCQRCTPHEVGSMLNDLYSRFDGLCEQPAFAAAGVYKVETVGDAYMLVCNLEQPCEDHADVVLAFARAMHESAAQVISPLGEHLRIRTVNTAARMESHGLPGMIQISGTTFDRLRQPETSNARYRGKIDVKGMGPVETFLVAGRDTPECFAALDSELEEAKKRSGGILNRISSVSTPGVRRRGSSSMAALVEDIAAMRAAETGSDLAPAKE